VGIFKKLSLCKVLNVSLLVQVECLTLFMQGKTAVSYTFYYKLLVKRLFSLSVAVS
jgi:hypothetical protein